MRCDEDGAEPLGAACMCICLIALLMSLLTHSLLRWDFCTLVQQLLYSTSTPVYTAIHMRMGALTGEGALLNIRGRPRQLPSFLDAVACANRLGTSRGISRQTPIMMIVDDHQLRNFLKVG